MHLRHLFSSRLRGSLLLGSLLVASSFSTQAVSYTHLDVYKRQLANLPLRSVAESQFGVTGWRNAGVCLVVR